MKRFLIAAVLALALPFAALAAVQEFEHFTIDVPAGWSTTQDGPTVGVMADDKSASMSVTVSEIEGGMPLRDVAAEMSKALGGTAPEVDSDGDHSFTFNNGASNAMITGEDGKWFMMLVFTGQNPALGDIMGSIKIKE